MDRLVRWLRGQRSNRGNSPRQGQRRAAVDSGQFRAPFSFCASDVRRARRAYTLLAIWTGAKLAASWHRFPVTSDEAGRQVRAGTMVALIAGIVSVGIGVLVGLIARWACLK